MKVWSWPLAAALTALSAAGQGPTAAVRPDAETLAALAERTLVIHRAREAYARLGAVPAEDFPAAWDGYRRQFGEASAEWVRRWPESEMAWRERLRALALEEASGSAVAEAIDRALVVREWGVGFTEDVRWPVARLATARGVRLDEVEGWIDGALEADLRRFPEEALEGLDAAEVRRGRAALVAKADRLRADLAFRRGDAERLGGVAWGEPPDAESPADSGAVFDWATARSDAVWKRARLARLAGRWTEALDAYQQAWRERPRRSKLVRPWDSDGLADEALGLWRAAGRSEADWRAWLVAHPGPRMQPDESGLVWESPGGPTRVEAGGRRLAAVWPGLDPRSGVALDRVQRRLDWPLLVLSDEADATALAAEVERADYRFAARAAPEAAARLNAFRSLPRLLRLDANGVVVAWASLTRWSESGLTALLSEIDLGCGRTATTERPDSSPPARPESGPSHAAP